MSNRKSITLIKDDITYVLTRVFEQLDANGTLAKKATYELTQTTSNHGSSREEMVALLAKKFSIPKSLADYLVSRLDPGAAEDELHTPRKRTDAPALVGGGIPTRPLVATR